ncbi:uncharacterized protein Z518_05253 [Rhinocladiella mackenziei CBS 650.93]|uniref:Mid2 domain-containing protein n=1 Tax=Rhinocladiella mackenziei CBS 650.93 TaxID=1442369 RepID=A0A0D2J5Q4_9EURO|nr:uncharacterized protein Z518_05253 [Rhinocladiella mackenziei CBS 650.93]KIX04385.1 hypothetical protein Z518_05253 [Rhinocladiella mackenziei CBS 650.93]
MKILFESSLLLTFLLLGRGMATCYFPNGDVSSADVACDAEASDSFCCYSKQACLSNKLCLTGVADGINQYARGTCTDQTWQSEQGLGNPVFSCNTTGFDSYCCNDGCSCDSSVGDEILSFAGTPYTISVIGVTSTYPNPSATTSSASVITSTSFSASAISSGPSGSSSADTAAPAATSSASTEPSSSGGGSNGTAIGAGVGVGVGVAILLLGGGAILYYRQRSKSRKKAAHQGFDLNKRSLGGVQPRRYTDNSPNHLSPMANQYVAPHSTTSELSGAGHEYGELGVGGNLAHTNRGSNIPELPGR